MYNVTKDTPYGVSEMRSNVLLRLENSPMTFLYCFILESGFYV